MQLINVKTGGSVWKMKLEVHKKENLLSCLNRFPKYEHEYKRYYTKDNKWIVFIFPFK